MFLIGAAILLLLAKSEASMGDYHPVFQQCNFACLHDLECPQQSTAFKWVLEPCFSCRQNCIWKTVEAVSENPDDEPVPQFYGKWPFAAYSLPLLSFIPMQEPASVLFSLLNMLAAIRLFYGSGHLPKASMMRNVWRMYAAIGIFTWIFSASFHWSDFWLTEYLDYFSAFGVILFAFFASISLVIAPFKRIWIVRILWKLLFIILLYVFVRHVWTMTVYFDYGYNMWCCLFYSFSTAFIYVAWISLQWNFRAKSKEDRRPLFYLGAVVALGLGSALLEMLDFPPVWWIIDAHSLFHLATVPMPLIFLRFIKLENQSQTPKLDGYSKFA